MHGPAVRRRSRHDLRPQTELVLEALRDQTARTMTDQDTIPSELTGRFHSRVILKQDVFSTVERGIFVTPNGDVEAVLRRIDSCRGGATGSRGIS